MSPPRRQRQFYPHVGSGCGGRVRLNWERDDGCQRQLTKSRRRRRRRRRRTKLAIISGSHGGGGDVRGDCTERFTPVSPLVCRSLIAALLHSSSPQWRRPSSSYRGGLVVIIIISCLVIIWFHIIQAHSQQGRQRRRFVAPHPGSATHDHFRVVLSFQAQQPPISAVSP